MNSAKIQEQLELVQLNARVPLKIKNGAKRICKRAKISLEIITADALRYYFGSTDDPILNARRTIVMETARAMREDWSEQRGSSHV